MPHDVVTVPQKVQSSMSWEDVWLAEDTVDVVLLVGERVLAELTNCKCKVVSTTRDTYWYTR